MKMAIFYAWRRLLLTKAYSDVEKSRKRPLKKRPVGPVGPEPKCMHACKERKIAEGIGTHDSRR